MSNTSQSSSSRDGVVQALVTAWTTGMQQPAEPWREALPTDDDSYAVHEATAIAMDWFHGTAPTFWKSGGGSRQSVLTHAPLPLRGLRSGSTGNAGAELSDLRFHAPKVEAEIALRLGRAVTPDMAAALTQGDSASLVDAMTVTIEVCDSRWIDGFNAPARLQLADLGNHAALIVGKWVPYTPCDWMTQDCKVQIGQRQVLLKTGTHGLGDPLWLLPAWLRHVTRKGQTVPAGTAVTTGSWIGGVDNREQAPVRVEFPGIGAVSVTF